MTLEFVPAREHHMPLLASALRPADKAECEALGHTVGEVLADSLAISVEAWTALEDGAPIAMWGLTAPSFLGRVATPWLLTGEGVERHKKVFLRETRWWVHERALLMFPHLLNVVDARYTRALRWLKWLGFTVHEPAPFGVLGRPFCIVELGG